MSVGFDTFARKQNTVFIVKNVAPRGKMIRIFLSPIENGMTKDLLEIPWVSEADIRANLLKGVLKDKILHGEIIVVQSNIDLSQFDSAQMQFLQSAGITTGLEATGFSPTAAGQSPFYDGSAWKLIGLLTGTNLTDADQTLTIAGGAQYVSPTSASLTSSRIKTLSLSGVSAGLMITIYRLNTSANTMVIKDAGGTTLFTFPASNTNPVVASFRVNDAATAWTLAGWAPLGPVV